MSICHAHFFFSLEPKWGKAEWIMNHLEHNMHRIGPERSSSSVGVCTFLPEKRWFVLEHSKKTVDMIMSKAVPMKKGYSCYSGARINRKEMKSLWFLFFIRQRQENYGPSRVQREGSRRSDPYLPIVLNNGDKPMRLLGRRMWVCEIRGGGSRCWKERTKDQRSCINSCTVRVQGTFSLVNALPRASMGHVASRTFFYNGIWKWLCAESSERQIVLFSKPLDEWFPPFLAFLTSILRH